MIIALYGDGKGKTTSAVGTLLRTLNLQKKVLFVQLFKDSSKFKSNEVEFLTGLDLQNLDVMQFKKNTGWVNFENPIQEDRIIASEAFLYIIKNLKKYSLIVADEFLLADYYQLVNKNRIIEVIKKTKVHKSSIIFTGRKFRKGIMPYFDLITHMKNVKHPYEDNNIKALEGIDF